jgi:hypothetical protein
VLVGQTFDFFGPLHDSFCVVLQIYAGLADPKIHPLGAESKTHPFSGTPPMTQLIQTVIFNMIANQRYGNECFLQLIRQTTNPTEPDG